MTDPTTTPIPSLSLPVAERRLQQARAYLDDVVQVALDAVELTCGEFDTLCDLGYIGEHRPSVPLATASHIELEAEMTFLLARRIATRLEGTDAEFDVSPARGE